MAGSIPEFTEINKRCAKQFLQHAVVVDNGFEFTRDNNVDSSEIYDLEAPTAFDTDETEQPSATPDTSVVGPGIGHPLNAKALIDSFADDGIICCTYKPDDGENLGVVVPRAVNVAKNADIVVIDWQLGSGGDEKALQIVEQLRDHDRQIGGRLRLIAIYTGFSDVNTQFKTLYTRLLGKKPDGPIDPLHPSYEIVDGNCLITFLNKQVVSNPQPGVRKASESELPGILIDKFTELTDGLMPNVALASISAIREATHHIISKYDGKLDGALLSHRALLATPDDSEGFAVRLIFDELATILEASDVGLSQISIQNLKSWVRNRDQGGLTFGFDSTDADELKRTSVYQILKKGLSADNLEWLVDNHKKKNGDQFTKNSIKRGIDNVFFLNEMEKTEALSAFTRYSSMRMEAGGPRYHPAGWLPGLQLGTIIGRELSSRRYEYLYCLQPLCDSVRIDQPRSFPFLQLIPVNSTEKFNLIIRTEDESDAYLKIDFRHFELKSFTFAPSKKDRSVKARHEGQSFIFSTTGRVKFRWLGDVKEVLSSRSAAEFGNRVSRIGTDEFEWLRLRTPNSG